MKKLLHFLVVLLGIFVAFILARLFIEIYTIVGDVYLQVIIKQSLFIKF